MKRRPAGARRLRRVFCPGCRRTTLQEFEERSGSIAVGGYFLPLADAGFHCYKCGAGWGFAILRAAWIRVKERPSQWVL